MYKYIMYETEKKHINAFVIAFGENEFSILNCK